jgi:hypothetical protein
MNFTHKNLAEGKWFELSFIEQMGNIGSEVNRTIKWFRLNDIRFQNAFERTLELIDLTLSDKRWKNRRKEIARSRELFCSLITESGKYNKLEDELNSFNNYFLHFAIASRLQREKSFN